MIGVLYESRDGVAWQAPGLGLLDHFGSSENNVFSEHSAGAITCLPPRMAHRGRYARIYQPNIRIEDLPDPENMHHMTQRIACSADGIHWEDAEANPVFYGRSDTLTNMVYNPERDGGDREDPFMHRLAGLLACALLAAVASATPPPEDFYVDVRSYLPADHVTDGSVDYKAHIQKCLDENLAVFFPGGDDPAGPMVYGITGERVGQVLKTQPHARLRFGPNAILKRLPSLGRLLWLAQGAHLDGAVIDGNKYAHWPLLADRVVKPYAYVIDRAVIMAGSNVIRDCFVYNNAGIAFSAWNSNDNRIYRTRVENCGFLEALAEPIWAGEHASADGFLFYPESRYNIVKDSAAIDCARWGFVVEGGAAYNTIVDCQGGDLHYRTFGFIDVEGAGPGNSLVRCRSPNSDLSIQSFFQEAIGCVARRIYAEHASYARFLGCSTAGGWFRLGEVRDDKLSTPGRQSPMLDHSRVFLGGASPHHSLTVVCPDGRGVVTGNVLYGHDDGAERSTEMLLYGVPVSHGTRQAWGQWAEPIAQLGQAPRYLRARVDFDFK